MHTGVVAVEPQAPTAAGVRGPDLQPTHPSTAEGAEYALVLGFVCLRAVTLVQVLVSLPSTLPRSTRPLLDLCLVSLYVAHSGVVAAVLCRARRWRSGTVIVDVLTGCVVLLSQVLITGPVDRMSTWGAWGFAATLGCSLAAGAALRRRRAVLLSVGALMASYVLASGGAQGSDQLFAALVNSLGYVALAAAGWISAGHLRRLGTEADRQRAAAARCAALAEAERHRRLLHDQATVLSMLSRSVDDPRLLDALQRQAAAGANQIHSFLQGREHAGDSRTLGSALRAAAQNFTDLPITLNVDLVDHLEIRPRVGTAVREAVSTLLHNVRLHAGATSCVLHADVTELAEGWRWEVVVRDDGRGFDPSLRRSGRPGFGLRRQVFGPLAAVDVDVTLVSAPGEGTTVTLTGSARASQEGPWPAMHVRAVRNDPVDLAC